jgi:hypothetical protein
LSESKIGGNPPIFAAAIGGFPPMLPRWRDLVGQKCLEMRVNPAQPHTRRGWHGRC